MNALRIAALVLLAAGAAGAQLTFGIVCTTDVPYATAFSNSHKLAARSELSGIPDDTVTLVFQSSAGVWTCLGVAGMGGIVWTTPGMLYEGQNPGIDKGWSGDRHLVWQARDSVSGAWQVWYRNLEYRMAPLLMSESRGDAEHPDVWGDADRVAHVVWEESRRGESAIYYRTCNETGILSDTFRVSSSGACFRPAIHFSDAETALVVLWQRVDSAGPTYSIVRREKKNGTWGPEIVFGTDSAPMRHPALDYGSPGEEFACAWEDSMSGNLDARFIGGNGGGYPTQGRSTVPVCAHLGTTWSYLFWQEQTGPSDFDILCHFYYFMSGWHELSLRSNLGISENVRNPSCLGATVVWTQGDGPEYKVMWAHFGYPIGVAEERRPTAVQALLAQPNPFTTAMTIRVPGREGRHPTVSVFDASGRLIRSLTPDRDGLAVWHGTDELGRPVPAGVYVARAASAARLVVRR